MRMEKYDAIAILEEVKMLDDSMYQYNSAYMEALDIAIKALESDAIPIEWIKHYGEENCFDYGTPYNAITGMLNAWKERKNND